MLRDIRAVGSNLFIGIPSPNQLGKTETLLTEGRTVSPSRDRNVIPTGSIFTSRLLGDDNESDIVE